MNDGNELSVYVDFVIESQTESSSAYNNESSYINIDVDFDGEIGEGSNNYNFSGSSLENIIQTADDDDNLELVLEHFHDSEYDMDESDVEIESPDDDDLIAEYSDFIEDKRDGEGEGQCDNQFEVERVCDCSDNNASGESDDGCEDSDNDDPVNKDIVQSDDELDSLKGSDGEGNAPKFPIFNQADLCNPHFQLGLKFPSKGLFKESIYNHAIQTMRDLRIKKNDKKRIHAKCLGNEKKEKKKPCKWRIHALKVEGEETFQIHEYYQKQKCSKTMNVRCIKSTWIAKRYLHAFQSEPTRKVKGFKKEVVREIKVNVSDQQAYRAKKKALLILEGDSQTQYSVLWDYIDEVKRTNPGSTLILGIDQSTGKNLFDRLYVCLNALKQGFKTGCRPVIGVDGCHLSGPHKGVLLSAVGIDPNNNIYPIAWAVVEKEDGDTWNWFLTILKIDLSLDRHGEWTFMSDKQKGLLQDFESVFPGADHRFCVRHLHGNLKNAGFKGQAFKDALWKAARATTMNEFTARMQEMATINPKAVEWFKDKPPEHWSKSHFKCYPNCDILLNNGCETFNCCIKDAREKGILTMLMWIMEWTMVRLQKNRDKCIERWRGKFCPKIKKMIDKHMDHLGDCIPTKSDDHHYQIDCWNGNKYFVDLSTRSCGCRSWDLSGIPCLHAVTAICTQGFEVEDFVHSYYHVDTYKKVYEHAVMPINGRSEWKKSEFLPPLPPNEGRGVARPKIARRNEPDETIPKQKKRNRGKPSTQSKKNPNRLKRQQKTVKCGFCGQEDHNARGCPLKKQNNTIGDAFSQVNNEATAMETIDVFNTSPSLKKLKMRKRPNSDIIDSTSANLCDVNVIEDIVTSSTINHQFENDSNAITVTGARVQKRMVTQLKPPSTSVSTSHTLSKPSFTTFFKHATPRQQSGATSKSVAQKPSSIFSSKPPAATITKSAPFYIPSSSISNSIIKKNPTMVATTSLPPVSNSTNTPNLALTSFTQRPETFLPSYMHPVVMKEGPSMFQQLQEGQFNHKSQTFCRDNIIQSSSRKTKVVMQGRNKLVTMADLPKALSKSVGRSKKHAENTI